MQITLDPWELEIVHQVGMRRNHANAHKGDAPHYDANRMEDNLRASIAAAACEAAVAKATCCYWTMSVWDSGQHYKYRELPDVLPNIEVRRVRENGNPLVVRKRETSSGRIIVSAYAHGPWFRRVDVTGWMSAKDAWEQGDPSTYDRQSTRLVDQELLHPIEELTAQELVVSVE